MGSPCLALQSFRQMVGDNLLALLGEKKPEPLKHHFQGAIPSANPTVISLCSLLSLNGSGPVSRLLSCLDTLCLMLGIFSSKNSNQRDLDPFLKFVRSKIRAKYTILLSGKHCCSLPNPEQTGSKARAGLSGLLQCKHSYCLVNSIQLNQHLLMVFHVPALG